MTKNKNTHSKVGNIMNLNIADADFARVEDVEIPEVYNRRFKTGIKQLDDLFQQGILPGSTFTITGTPGAGKTTLMLQMLDSAAALHGKKVGYVSGEESQVQLAFSAGRIGIKHVLIAHKCDIDQIAADVRKHKFDLLIIDSFPTMKSANAHGSKATEAYVVSKIIEMAQENETVVGVVLHITKKGDAKGSTLIPHSVDANWQLMVGDEEVFGTKDARVLEVKKNRFGCTGEASFYMTPKGFDLDTDMELLKQAAAANASKSPSKDKRNQRAGLTEAIIAKAQEAFGITLPQAVQITGNYYAGRNLLKEMTTMGQLRKFGRGDDARWEVVSNS